MGFVQESIHIEVADLAAIDLTERNLKFATVEVILQSAVIVFGEQHIEVLSLVVPR